MQWQSFSLLILANVLIAVNEVYVANMAQYFDPLAVTAICLGILIVFFTFKIKNITFLVSNVAKEHKNVFLLNVHTAFTWIPILYAVKLIEPAIASSLSLFVMPLTSQVIERHEIKFSIKNYFFLLVLLLLSMLFCWSVFAGKSAVSNLPFSTTLYAVSLSIFSGIGMTLQNLYSQKLFAKGLEVEETMLVRYFLTFIISVIFCSHNDLIELASITHIYKIFFLAFVCSIIPVYAYNIGLKKITLHNASLITSTGNLFTLLIQLLDDRLKFSFITSSLIILSCLFCILNVIFKPSNDEHQ